MRKIILIFLVPITIFADPWGKDADLASCKKNDVTIAIPDQIETPIFGWFGETMIGFHQNIISPADGPRSHFLPSSSQYTLEAMRKYGFFKGFVLGCDRLMRENDDPWVYQKIDTGNSYLKWNPIPNL